MLSALLHSHQNRNNPSFLAIGHITRDLLPGNSFLLGGTVAFAALTAAYLGEFPAIVTRADQSLLAALAALLPNIELAAHLDPVTTTFENYYHEGQRIQYLRQRAAPLELTDIPSAWCDAPIILLGPLAQEISLDLIRTLPRSPGSLLAAIPQGWLRRWDADGRIYPTQWEAAEQILPLLDVLLLSRDDLRPFSAEGSEAVNAVLTRWSGLVPLLIATDGRNGATLFEHGSARHFAAYPANEVDPTGAGDVFAAAFLIHFSRQKDPAAAMNFANCVASLSIEHPGTTGIPTLEQIQARLLPFP
jgi:1D-myo-inositol 3-kinase